jgi:hypothetical protein
VFVFGFWGIDMTDRVEHRTEASSRAEVPSWNLTNHDFEHGAARAKECRAQAKMPDCFPSSGQLLANLNDKSHLAKSHQPPGEKVANALPDRDPNAAPELPAYTKRPIQLQPDNIGRVPYQTVPIYRPGQSNDYQHYGPGERKVPKDMPHYVVT